MFLFIKSLIFDFIDLVFPVLCLGCEETLRANEKVLCTTCRISLPETELHRQYDNQNLRNKFAGKVPVQLLLSYLYFSKGSVVQKLIHRIKYKGQKEAAKELASWYGHQLKLETDVAQEIDLLISVPLHTSRLEQRGYNQADWIAVGLSEALTIPTRTDVLIRTEFKGSQTRKDRSERWENVKNVFSVVDQEAVKDKNIAIVDDVLTTGATMEACIVELLKAGCKSVSVLTLATTYR